jgi:hypothetical protein
MDLESASSRLKLVFILPREIGLRRPPGPTDAPGYGLII